MEAWAFLLSDAHIGFEQYAAWYAEGGRNRSSYLVWRLGFRVWVMGLGLDEVAVDTFFFEACEFAEFVEGDE